MGSIQISLMSWERSGRPGRFSFFPKGAFTHHPAGAVVFPAETVRSPRGIAASADAAGRGCISVKVPALSMQSARGFHFGSPYLWGGILPPRLAACLCQPATGSLTQIQGCNESFHPCWRYVAFHDVPVGIRCGRRATAFHSNPSERMVDNGNLSFRGQNGQPWSRTLCRGCCGLSELFPDAQ